MTGPLLDRPRYLEATPTFTPAPKCYGAALQGKSIEVQYAMARVKAAREGVCPASLEYLEAADAVAALGPDGHPSPDMDRSIRARLVHALKDLRDCHARVKLEESKLEEAERSLHDAAATADRLLA